MSKLTILVVASALLIGGLMGFLTSTFLQPVNKTVSSSIPEQNMPTTSDSSDTNNMFSSQNATIEGVITDRKDASVTVKNSQNNKSETFNIDPSATILKIPARTTRTASPSSDLRNIELNSPVIVSLDLKNGQYVVVNIAYLPTTPNKL